MVGTIEEAVEAARGSVTVPEAAVETGEADEEADDDAVAEPASTTA
jgi:hypothetical protein